MSTPPKSETTAWIMRGAAGRSGRSPTVPSIRQRTNAHSQPQRAELERRAAQHLADHAPRVVVVLADPQLEPGAELAPSSS